MKEQEQTSLEDKINELQNEVNDVRFLNLEADMREKNQVFISINREKIINMKLEQALLDLSRMKEERDTLQVMIANLHRQAFKDDGHIEQ
jgi:ribosomal protein L9